MQWVKRSLWVLAGLLAVLITGIGTAIVWLDSRTGKTWLEATINDAAGGMVRVTAIGGSLPFHPTVESIELTDARGRWGGLHKLRLDIAPLDLLRRRITIQHLSADRIEIDRPPEAQQAEPVEPQPAVPSRDLPQLPVAIDVHQLTVGSLSLPPDILGEPTVWTVDATAHLIGRDLGFDLKMAEIGFSPLRLDVRFELAEGRAGAQASLDDPRGLLLHRATGEAQPLQVRLTDDPSMPRNPGDWHGRLIASIGDNARLEAGLRLVATAASFRLDTHGTFEGADLLPPTVAPLLGNAVRFNIAAHDKAGERIALENLELQAAAFEAMGTGTYLMNENSVEASFRLAAPDLAPFSGLADQPLAGSAILTISANGPLDLLHAEADLNAAHLSAGTLAMDAVHARVDAEVVPGQGYEIRGYGHLAEIRSGDSALPARLGELVEWRLAGRSDVAGEHLALAQFDVSTAGVELSAEAALDRITEDVNGALRLRLNELQHYAELSVPGLAGRGQITAGLTGKMNGPMTLRVDGDFNDLVTGIPAADALLGRHLHLEAAAQRDTSGRIEIESASLAASAARLTARGTMDPAADQLDGEVAVSVEDLAVLHRAGLQTKGHLQLDAQLSGSLSAPMVDARLAGSSLAWQATQIDQLTARLQARMEDAPSGELTADMQSRGLALHLDGQAALSPDRKVLNVSRLRLRSDASVVEARLQTMLDTFLTSGRITADIPELAPWSLLAGMDLGGRFNMDLALSALRGGQAVELNVAAHDLRIGAAGGDQITVRQLSANGALTDLLRRPAGHLKVNGEQMVAAGAHIDGLRVTARSSEPNRFGIEGKATGEFKGRFNLATTGDVALDPETTRLTFAQFGGRLANTPLQLKKPLSVAISGAGLDITDLSLAVGDGTVEGTVRRDADRFDVDLTARQLPIGLGAALAGRPEISGVVDLQVAVAGPAAQPRGQLTLVAGDLRAGPARRDQPVIGIDTVANIAPSEIEIDAAVIAGGKRLVAASGVVPVTFGPAPGVVSLAKQRALRLNLRGEGELAALADFLPLAGDRLAGSFRLALDADGPMAQPQFAGELSLNQGHYENLASGLVIDALALQIEADRDRVVLRHLEATDGGKGKLEGSGAILLNGGQTPRADATVNVTGFRALRRGDATLSTTGSATVQGPMDALGLVARITVDEAEFFIPDPPPAGAKKIPVTIIDSATGRVLEQPDKPASADGGTLDLDVVIHVPGRTFIRGRGLDSEWEGDIRVQGTSAAPELTGALQVSRGKFAFFGKDLELTRGTVAFTGGSKIEPDLDILAETTDAGTTFQVGAGGTPDDLRIKLSSIPPLPEDEILSRMIFGREMTRLTPAQGLQLAQAAATLASGGPGMLDKMRQKLGLDTLNVGSGSDNDNLRPSARGDTAGGSSGTENTAISAGKYVADGVYVGAEQRLSGETRSKVEIEIMPNVSVETTAGNRGESVGIIWKWDY